LISQISDVIKALRSGDGIRRLFRAARAAWRGPEDNAGWRMFDVLDHAEARVALVPTGDGRHRVQVTPAKPTTRIARNGCLTSYPRDLIGQILRRRGPAGLCDEISRDEDPGYTSLSIRNVLLALSTPSGPAAGEVLDFGCGCGASTVVLGRMLPESRILGLDLDEKMLDVARARARHWGLRNVRFALSSGARLPEDVGTFGSVMLSAVYEHLTPDEREPLLRKLWSVLGPGGCLHICETPYRWFPVDAHTTLLPLVNYLPRFLALRFARKFSQMVSRGQDWEGLLRMGIRGATTREVMRILRRAGGGDPLLLRPNLRGKRTWTDLWFAGPTLHSYPRGRRVVRLLSAALERSIGIPLVPFLSVAFRKADR